MKILQAGLVDPAGTAIALKKAIEAHTPHECRAIRERDNYLCYEKDIETKDAATWREMMEWADIIHIHEYRTLWDKARGQAPIVWHLHGNCFKAHFDDMNATLDQQRITAVVSTPDLLNLRPSAVWLPIPIDLNRFAGLRPAKRDGFRVVQTPTRHADKIFHVSSVNGIEADVVMSQTNAEALRRKAQASVCFDQFASPLVEGSRQTAVIAMSGLEAMGMGIPVLAGGPEERLIEYRRLWGKLPFMPTTPEELPIHLEMLRGSPDLLNHWAERGLAHVKKWHDPATVAAKAVAIYEEVLGAQ